MKLLGKTAIITGAAGGIGKAAALLMAQEGANIVILDINEDAANAVVNEIIQLGGSAMAAQADVRDSNCIKQVVSEAIGHYGSIDILVNNAGGPAHWHGKSSFFADSEEETWRFVIDVNLIGTMIVTQAVLKSMIEKHKGKIVNIGSVSGVNGLAKMVDYSAAKGGVISMTRALAIELGEHNINVNCVSPGSIQTHGASPQTFLKRYGTPEEVASLILFLASDDSDFITGQNFIIDGGRCLSTKC